MAKQVKETSAKKFTFGNLSKSLDGITKGGGMMSTNEISKISDYTSTGNYILNACLSGSLFKGIPNNRSVCLSGESGVGKTYLALNCVREFLNKYEDGMVMYCDSENAVDVDLMESFNIDTDRVWYEPVGTVQQFNTVATKAIDDMIKFKNEGGEIPKFMLVLDSVGNLATQKEIDDAISGSDKADFSKAKNIKRMFRILMTTLGQIGGTYIFTNHIYKSMDLFAQDIQAGGSGVTYGASVILNMTKAKLKEGTAQIGNRVTARPQKNRLAIPHNVEFNIRWDSGMNPYIGLQEWADAEDGGLSWDKCGVGQGKLITKKEYDKLTDSQKKDCRQHPMDADTYYQYSSSGRNVCLDDSLETVPYKDYATAKVWTKSHLERLDEYIKTVFTYAGHTDDTDEIFDELENGDVVDTETGEVLETKPKKRGRKINDMLDDE